MGIEKLQLYISYIAPIVTFLCTAILWLKKVIKNKKIRNILYKTDELAKKIIPYITVAEQFNNYSGEEKKEYVMTKLNQLAIEFNLEFDSISMEEKIEELIYLTKKVNVKNEGNELSYINANDTKVTSASQENIEEKIKRIIESMRR